jgi:hypothetical protein
MIKSGGFVGLGEERRGEKRRGACRVLVGKPDTNDYVENLGACLCQGDGKVRPGVAICFLPTGVARGR